MKRPLLWFLILATLLLLFWGGARTWQRQQDHQAALAEDQLVRQNPRLRLSHEEVMRVHPQQLPLQVAISGTVRPLHHASVRAQYGGEVLDLQVREGERVVQGQVLFRIAAPDAAARLQQASQQAQAALAEQHVAQRHAENHRALAAQGFISETALRNAESSLKAAQATYRAAIAGVDVARKSVEDSRAQSPLSGVVATRHVQPHEVVNVGEAVLDIVDLRSFELHASLPAQDSTQVAVGQAAQIQVEGTSHTLPAEVVRVSPMAQEGSRTIAVYLRIQTPSPTDADAASTVPPLQLRDGLFARGTITTGQVQALALPPSAIRNDKPQPYVLWLQADADNPGTGHYTVRHRPVQPGARVLVERVAWQIVQGLEADTPVLLAGAGLLQDGTPVQLDAVDAVADGASATAQP